MGDFFSSLFDITNSPEVDAQTALQQLSDPVQSSFLSGFSGSGSSSGLSWDSEAAIGFVAVIVVLILTLLVLGKLSSL